MVVWGEDGGKKCDMLEGSAGRPALLLVRLVRACRLR